MDELETLGRRVRLELGEPTEAWLAAQRQRLSRESLPASRSGRGRAGLVLALAALTAVALVIGVFASQRAEQPSTQAVTLFADTEPQRVRLQDGSSAALRPGARAVVATQPTTIRFELLQGSAEFDVLPQRGRQFIVVAGTFEISVVGTRFSVHRQPSGAVDVEVGHGVVSVRGPGRELPTRLAAGERFHGDPSRPPLEPSGGVSSAAPVSRNEGTPSAEDTVPTPSAAESARVATASADWEGPYRERRYAAAVARAKEHGIERLLTTLSAQKLAELADAARLGGDVELAFRALRALERRFPGSSQAADAEFLVGRLYATRGDSASALARFEKYLQRGERAPYAVEATGRLVELYSARGDTERARRMANQYLQRAPHGPYRRLCLSVLEKP